MREIKFRAWDTNQNTYVPNFNDEDEYAITGDGRVLIKGNNAACGDPECCGPYEEYLTEAKHFTLMQYTGLKDKNNVEIYEGDIVDDGYRKYAIEWWSVLNHDDNFTGFMDISGEYARGVEVIGNVYESPDLLEKK